MSKCWYWEHGIDKPVEVDFLGLEEATGQVCIKVNDYCKMINPSGTYDSEAFAIKCQQETLDKRLYNYQVLVFYAATPHDRNPKQCLYIGPGMGSRHILQEVGGERFNATKDQIYGVYATPKQPN